MILVLTGTSSWHFDRLTKAVDDIAKEIQEEIIIFGNTNYKPRSARFLGFISSGEIEQFYQKARIIVAHAGTGSIINSLKHKKPIIIVPRRKEYGESFDNHQVQTARELENHPNIYVVYDIEMLKNVINKVKQTSSVSFSKERDKLIESFKEYLKNL